MKKSHSHKLTCIGGFVRKHMYSCVSRCTTRTCVLLFLFSFVVVVVIVIALFFSPSTKDTTYPQIFIAYKGETIRSVANRLYDEGHINSPTLFLIANRLIGDKILYGSYNFTKPTSVFRRAYDLYTGNKYARLTRVVVPEGVGGDGIADILEKKFDNFDTERFRTLAHKHHGYLYPDTYFFIPEDVTADKVIDVMLRTFEKRTEDIFTTYTGDLTKHQLVTLASIVELESGDFEERRIIASVLYNRLAEGIPLQVDVSFLFINGKSTFSLTREDLQIDDLSNTYKHAGIPPIPITNPSVDSLDAIINPATTDYFYFLADKYQKTHFSKTHEEHIAKKAKYIRN